MKILIGVLRHVTYQGAPLVKGKRVTGFTSGEEEEKMHLTHVVPFLVENELMRLGATFEKLAGWQPLAVVDGRLVTGQNPASSTVAAQNLVNLLAAEKAAQVSTSIDAGIGSSSVSVMPAKVIQVRLGR
jgi:putative intracellular protease/amidase